MHLIFRTLFFFLRPKGSDLAITDVSRVDFRVLPTDLDVMGHMNNGVYLSIMDLGRMDLFRRSGVWAKIVRVRMLPVMANESITFRKSLQPWQRFTIETRIVGYDAKSLYAEQQVVVAGEIYARATMRLRFTRRGEGAVTIAEFAAVTGVDTANRPPAPWIERWTADVALPPTKAPAPSSWS